MLELGNVEAAHHTARTLSTIIYFQTIDRTQVEQDAQPAVRFAVPRRYLKLYNFYYDLGPDAQTVQRT